MSRLQEEIGREVHCEIKRQGITTKELADTIHTCTQNAYYIYKGRGMDIDRVMTLSLLLRRDFFAELSKEYKSRMGIPDEDREIQAMVSSQE